MHLRKFVPTDLEDILTLFHDVVHAVGLKYYSHEQVEAWAPETGIDKEAWLTSLGENITYVALDHNKLIGFADMTRSGHIDRLYVHQKYQGRGVSALLFKKLEEEAKRLKLLELTLEASLMSKPIAERHGFQVVREQKKELRGQIFVTYWMRKTL